LTIGWIYRQQIELDTIIPRVSVRAKGVPLALSQSVKCNHVLHENVLLVAVTTTDTPRVWEDDRVAVAPISKGITRIELRFGFMEQPNVPEGLTVAAAQGKIANFDPATAIYYTGHETIIPSGRRKGLARWREALFAFMHHNAQRPGGLFQDPRNADYGNRRRIRKLTFRDFGHDIAWRAYALDAVPRRIRARLGLGRS
jgi:K+ transporter